MRGVILDVDGMVLIIIIINMVIFNRMVIIREICLFVFGGNRKVVVVRSDKIM